VKKLLIAAAALALAPVVAFAADLSGAWTVNASFDSVGIKYTVTCTLAQDGAGKLTGPCKDDAGSNAATGTVDGSTVSFAYDTTYGGNPYHLTYKGALQTDGSLTGSVDASGQAQGTFTATKK
jgi:opacity protein-like surface antigen